jgi:AbiV family abortive infection protein
MDSHRDSHERPTAVISWHLDDAVDDSELTRELFRLFGQPSDKGALSIDEAAAGMNGAYQNAVALLNEAALLARADAWARAGALVVLGLEELAKIPDIHDTVLQMSVTPTETGWKSFWTRFFDHGAKQRAIAAYGRPFAPGSPTERLFGNPGPYAAFLPEDLGKLLDLYKQRSLYLDRWGKRFVVPGSLETAAIVDHVFALGQERADSFAWLHGTPERSTTFLKSNIEASQTGRPHSVPLRPHSDPTDLVIDLHSMLAHRSSSVVPDHLTLREMAFELTGDDSDELIADAVEMEVSLLAQRMETEQLPTAARRAFGMVKLLMGFCEQRGIDFRVPERWKSA